MKKSLLNDMRGVAHMAVALGVVVIVVVGAVGYYVATKDKDEGGKGSSKVVNSEAQKACNDLYNDKDLCKFASKYDPKAAYKANFAVTDKDGKATTMELAADSKGNTSMITKDGDKEVSAFVSLDGDSYIKNIVDGTWTKYPKSQSTAEETTPSDDLKLDFTKEAAKPADQRTSYKKLGKEACGNRTCFKYEFIDPAQSGVKSYIWFDTKDYQLRKWEYSDKDGSKNVATFDYTSVKISVPSPVKEASTTTDGPSEAELQQYLNQAQQYSE